MRASLRVKSMIGLNTAMVLILGIFLFWDFRSTWFELLRVRREGLRAEAAGIAVAVQRLDRGRAEQVQSYIDDVCSRMRGDASPGHHIAVVSADATWQALEHRPPSPGLMEAIRRAAQTGIGIGPSPGGDIVVGHVRTDGLEVYVSEFLSDIRAELRRRALTGTLRILVLAALLAVAANLFTIFVVARPLEAVAEVARRIGSGELGAQAPVSDTTEIDRLAREVNEMSRRLSENAEEHRRAMAKGRRIQEKLLPDMPEIPGLRVAWVFRPALSVAGDYYDFALREDAVLLGVADVAGHGVPAALLAAMLKSMFAAAVQESTSPARVLATVNDKLAAVTLDEDFATMIVVTVEFADDRLRYASAGHELGYLIPPNGEPAVLSATGPVLGVVPGIKWEEEEIATRTGDRLVLLTDGLPETTSPSGEMYGRKRLEDLMLGLRGKPLDELPKRILDRLAQFRGNRNQADDLTIVVAEFVPR